VVEILARHGCSDAVFTEIGPGALGHLRAAGIRGWLAPSDVPVPELVERLSRGELPAVNEPTSAGGAHRRERRGGECGSTESRGTGAGRGRGCCGQQRHRRQLGAQT
jgi:predicted Fe-Mo cluster-binding NifX family protein